MKITSPAFSHNGNIPSKYACDGENINPHLLFDGIPEGTKSLALIVDDPDAPAGTWVHWVVWEIAPDIKEIKEGSAPKGSKQGKNDFRNKNYGGPCPPSGTHRYLFKLYALDAVPDVGRDAGKAELERAMEGHIVARAEIIGLYKRKR